MKRLMLVVACMAVIFASAVAGPSKCPFQAHDPEFRSIGGAYGKKVMEMAETMAVPRIGFQAPLFKAKAVLPDKTFATISLEDYVGKWVVLFFYPLDFTFVCPTEILAFSEAQVEKFASLNTVVLGASVDSVYSHLAWINTPRKSGGLGELSIPLLEDVTKELANKYGVLHLDSGHTNRGLFIIDPHGKLRHITMNEPPVGRNVQEVVRLVEAFQHVDAHGEVCPANWSKGKPTMVADPDASKAYFASQHA